MIRAAIAGADTFAGAQLIRILINHPDVEITAAIAPSVAGQRVADVHPGLVGDTDLTFVAEYDMADVDVVFISGETPYSTLTPATHDGIRVIDLTGERNAEEGFVPGIPELYRKQLVRGARGAYIPAQGTTLAALALLPLARHLLLNDTITISGDIDDPDTVRTQVGDAIRELQNSFDSEIVTNTTPSPHTHLARASVSVRCGVDLEHLKQIFEEYYDDHNLTFIIANAPGYTDVANTAKAMLYLTKEEDVLTVTAAHDPAVRGSASVAVHCLNLLFGLSERIGLTLMPLATDRL